MPNRDAIGFRVKVKASCASTWSFIFLLEDGLDPIVKSPGSGSSAPRIDCLKEGLPAYNSTSPFLAANLVVAKVVRVPQDLLLADHRLHETSW